MADGPTIGSPRMSKPPPVIYNVPDYIDCRCEDFTQRCVYLGDGETEDVFIRKYIPFRPEGWADDSLSILFVVRGETFQFWVSSELYSVHAGPTTGEYVVSCTKPGKRRSITADVKATPADDSEFVRCARAYLHSVVYDEPLARELFMAFGRHCKDFFGLTPQKRLVRYA